MSTSASVSSVGESRETLDLQVVGRRRVEPSRAPGNGMGRGLPHGAARLQDERLDLVSILDRCKPPKPAGSPVDVGPAVAAELAVWGVEHVTPPPEPFFAFR